MQSYINQPLTLGNVHFSNRLIQGPLAGYSCAPFRALFSQFTAPAYCVSEMISAQDVIYKHLIDGRYLYRSPQEGRLCYQISGTDPVVMAEAAAKLDNLHADLIDINCGCPKPKIRKKGAGSALLEQPERLVAIVKAIKNAIRCPLTVKIRLQDMQKNLNIAKKITDAGADALIVHGRRWVDDYDVHCDVPALAAIKQAIDIPVIYNGDIRDLSSLKAAYELTGCDGFMIARASTGKPWLFEQLLTHSKHEVSFVQILQLFIHHLNGLSALENEYQAILQSKSLVRYYFRNQLDDNFLKKFYQLSSIQHIENALSSLSCFS